MSALKEQYAALKAKRDQEMKEIEMKLVAMKKTSPGKTTNKGKTPQEIQAGNTDGTILDVGSSLLRCKFMISGQISEPGQTVTANGDSASAQCSVRRKKFANREKTKPGKFGFTVPEF